jgi:hypothetical protein
VVPNLSIPNLMKSLLIIGSKIMAALRATSAGVSQRGEGKAARMRQTRMACIAPKTVK